MSQHASAIECNKTIVDAEYPVLTGQEVGVFLRISQVQLQELVRLGFMPAPLVSSEPKWLRAELPTVEELNRITDATSKPPQGPVTRNATSESLPEPVYAEELARAIGVQVRTLRNYRRDRRVPLPISGRSKGGRLAWDRGVVERWLRGEHPEPMPAMRPTRGRPRQW